PGPAEPRVSTATDIVSCRHCAATTTVPETFAERRRFFRRFRECPTCVEKRSQREARQTLYLSLLFLVGGVAAAAVGLPIGIVFINLFIMQVAVVLMIIPHELGHLLTARALGLGAPAVLIGVGRRLFTTSAFGAKWELRAVPLGGLTLISDRGLPGLRWRMWLAVLAGPVVSGLVLLAIWAVQILVVGRASFGSLFDGFAPVAAFVWANILILVTNLLPLRTTNVLGQKQGNDGHLLLTLPFFSRDQIDELRTMSAALEAHRLMLEDRDAEARARVDDALARHPDDIHLLNIRAALLLSAGDFSAGRRAFLELLEREERPLYRAMLSSNVAWSSMMVGGAERIAEAERLSAEAMAALPFANAVRIARGVTLTATDRPEEGLELLQGALATEQEPAVRSTIMMAMAYAYTAIGKTADADALIEAVRRRGGQSAEIDNLHAKILDLRPADDQRPAAAAATLR
ncbi:MAG: site-2 protease family protein, partial [Acidobacteriota bacterium]